MDSYTERRKKIVDYFEKEKQAELKRLEAELKSAQSGEEQRLQQSREELQSRGNQLSVQHEREKRSFNRQAAARGIGTGSAAQSALEQRSAYLRELGRLGQQQSRAQEEGRRRISALGLLYGQRAAEAAQRSDRSRDKALSEQEEKHYKEQLNRAQVLAKYGDFSMYAGLYGPEQAENMRRVWLAQNPQLAFKMGELTAGEYKALTGKNPPGYGYSGRRGSGRKKKPSGDMIKKQNGAGGQTGAVRSHSILSIR